MNFIQLKELVKKINIKTSTEYKTWASSKDKPENVPYNIRYVYKKQFKNWDDFFR